MKKKKLRKCLIILVIIAIFIAGIFIGKVLNKSNKNTNENSQTKNDGDILIGMTSKCSIILQKSENTIAVATEAITNKNGKNM